MIDQGIHKGKTTTTCLQEITSRINSKYLGSTPRVGGRYPHRHFICPYRIRYHQSRRGIIRLEGRILLDKLGNVQEVLLYAT
jgi:hypothetical protein